MFSFHKPKVYRSPTGCCICKAKSSSSRFTDSRKYEEDFVECFQLPSPRKGEICNACVLLVKRFKRLPPGSDRHWGHVVDARVGPGLKSMTKFKKKKEEKESAANGFGNSNPPPEKFLKIMKKKSKKLREESAQLAAEQKERENSPTPSDDSTPGSPLSYHSDADDNLSDVDLANGRVALNDISRGKENNKTNSNAAIRQRRKGHKPSKRKAGPPDCGGFLQPGYWSSVKMCCGIVFKGAGNELAIDIMNYKPCAHHLSQKRAKTQQAAEMTDVVIPSILPSTKDKVFSDNSSDSGYDEYSNQEKFLALVATEQDQEKAKAKVLNLDKNTVVVGSAKRINSLKPNFVLNGASIKTSTVKVSSGNLIKQNNIVLIKPKKQVMAIGNAYIVKSPTPVSSVTQVQQAAN